MLVTFHTLYALLHLAHAFFSSNFILFLFLTLWFSLHIKYSSSIVCNNANHSYATPAALLPRVQENSQVAVPKVTSSAQVVDNGMDHGVPSWVVPEQKTRYADTLEAQRSCAMFSDGAG